MAQLTQRETELLRRLARVSAVIPTGLPPRDVDTLVRFGLATLQLPSTQSPRLRSRSRSRLRITDKGLALLNSPPARSAKEHNVPEA